MRVIRSCRCWCWLVRSPPLPPPPAGSGQAGHETRREGGDRERRQQAAEDAAKKAAKKAMAPDAVDLNSATPEQLAKIGLDEATVKKVVESRPSAAWTTEADAAIPPRRSRSSNGRSR